MKKNKKEKLFGGILNMKNNYFKKNILKIKYFLEDLKLKYIVKKRYTKEQKIKDLRDYYFLTRKIIKSKVLSYEEGAHLAMMFVCIEDDLPKDKRYLKDELYDKLLDLNIKIYKK